jgi:hypothetical protein
MFAAHSHELPLNYAHVGPAEAAAAKPAFHAAFVEHGRNRIVVDGKRVRLIVRGSDSLMPPFLRLSNAKDGALSRCACSSVSTKD